MKKQLCVASVALLLVTLFAVSAFATDAQMYFATDRNGQNRVTNIQEGMEIWIVVIDNDKNIDCDLRDKVWADIKVFDPKTGAYIVWNNLIVDGEVVLGVNLHLRRDLEDLNPMTFDFLEETGADTGVFVSKRPFRVGTRESYASGSPELHTHVVDALGGVGNQPTDFQWGGFEYTNENVSGVPAAIHDFADIRGALIPSLNRPRFDREGILGALALGLGNLIAQPPSAWNTGETDYIIGRFENNNTLIGMYQDPRDARDVATTMAKIIDTTATISWDREIYKDGRMTATITIVDPDENLDCNRAEYVPFFVIINPGSWNPVQRANIGPGGDWVYSPTNFCMLMATGGVDPTQTGSLTVRNEPIRWYNIYNSGLVAADMIDLAAGPVFNQQPVDGNPYFMQYPTPETLDWRGNEHVLFMDTVDPTGFVRVMFYAQETGVDTGVFQYNFNDLRRDLGFINLDPGDVLVAYYVDPNDFDDMTLATAYIEHRDHISRTSFTDANRNPKNLFWIGRDPVYVQVIDANANVDPCCPEQVVVHICDVHGEDDSEWLVLDETSSNSPVFFSFSGTRLLPVWDALGVGLGNNTNGGFQLQLDNWKLEVFNEDTVYVRYNDVYYSQDINGMLGLGDGDTDTAFPPYISRIRVANDISFDLMKIASTEVFDGTTTNMWFLDRQGNKVTGYVNSDCVFIMVRDPDQDEDSFRRERISGWWDGGQNWPFGPMAMSGWDCGPDLDAEHPFNNLLGWVDIFNAAARYPQWQVRDRNPNFAAPKLYVMNPRNGYWAALDLLETGVATGEFVSVICIELVAVHECVPTLGVRPGDTIVAFYQDPSNHSDSAMISIKVGVGGATTPPAQKSTTMFVNAAGAEVQNYTDADMVYVKVVDPSHAGAPLLANAVEIKGAKYDLKPFGGASGTFITAGLDLDLEAGDTITATYTDPTDPTDTSSDTITIVASSLVVERFFAGPSPFATEVTFGFVGTGVATTMTVTVTDLAGKTVWQTTMSNVSAIKWNGTGLANGAYLYTVTATDGTNNFHGNGKVFINR